MCNERTLARFGWMLTQRNSESCQCNNRPSLSTRNLCVRSAGSGLDHDQIVADATYWRCHGCGEISGSALLGTVSFRGTARSAPRRVLVRRAMGLSPGYAGTRIRGRVGCTGRSLISGSNRGSFKTGRRGVRASLDQRVRPSTYSRSRDMYTIGRELC